jgi:sigma-B regulation protein RsbU (phosphoserine phosphatase)
MEAVTPFFPKDSLEQQVARLQALLEAARQVHSTIQTREVMLQTARILVRELEFEGALFLGPGSDVPLAAYGEVPPPPYENCTRFPLRSGDNQTMAELVLPTADSSELSLYELDFVEGLALQAAVALENAALHERDVNWARVQQDLEAARAIQRSLLPRAMPHLPGFSIAGRSTTCYEVGGDYLDAMVLPDGSHLLVVADVAGKGLASAIVATSLRSSLRSLATQPLPLAEMAARIGQLHWEEGPEARRRYMTALLVRLEKDTGAIEVVNAGHNPAVLVLPDAGLHMIEASGTPLRMLPRTAYSTERLDFPAGATMLLYTDGLTEVFHEEDEFGTERLIDAFRAVPSEDATEILDCLWETLNSFSGSAPQTDDMTAVAVCRCKEQLAVTQGIEETGK